MILGLEWFLDTPTGLTALLMILCCFFAAAYQWTKTGRKVDDTGYVRMQSGPLGLFSKKVPLRHVPKETLEGIVADMKAHDQEPPQAILDVLNPPVEKAPETKEAVNSQGVHASANSGSPEAQNPIELIDPELAAMLNLNASPAGQPLQSQQTEKEIPSLSAPPQAPKPYRCKFCPKVYTAANSLSMHMARKHPKEYAKQLKAKSK